MASTSPSTLLLSIPSSSSLPPPPRHGLTLPAIRTPATAFAFAFLGVTKFPNSVFVRGEPKPPRTHRRFPLHPLLNSLPGGGGLPRAGSSSLGDADGEDPPLVGEDSAAFDLAKQKISSWVYFAGILGTVLFVLDVAWLDNSTGYGKPFIDAVSGLSDSPEVVMLILIVIFATVHSGLASLRDTGEKLIGERAYRVLFAGISLPLAVSTVVYFINHRYDGQQLWQLQNIPGLHQFLWLSSFISFFFLYPSTFNLLEVAAVDKPKMHLWETGIMRITRHPQGDCDLVRNRGLCRFLEKMMVGQVIWCIAHTIWIGNSVAVAASLGLIGHHLFGVWNGDRRLAIRYGENFEAVKRRTSVVPFAAILDGRQKLPKDYYKEFIRLPYLAITAMTLGAYLAHPLMQAGSYGLHW
ncbi:NnrU domain containing protein [Trema orientale]|uniref:NnrU domain containing protein n=1 Tax=Trema orientale TaxID=63057 RepID=A0A2P5FCS3_TREOI|nr:NnrU domain containing protein [Trema orientale]